MNSCSCIFEMQQASEGSMARWKSALTLDEIARFQQANKSKNKSSVKVMLHCDDRPSKSTNDGRTVMGSNLAS